MKQLLALLLATTLPVAASAQTPAAAAPSPLLHLAQAPAPMPPTTVTAGPVTAGPLRLENGWTRAAGQGAQGVGFLTIRNTGTEADRLVAASSPAAARVDLHTSLREGDIMRMRPVENLPVPAGGSVTLAPGGLHLMMMGLTRPLAIGQSVPVTLRFERAGQVTVNMAVQSAGARAPMPMPAHRHQ